MARILSNKVYTMQTFLEIILEHTYINQIINDRTFIHKMMKYFHIPTQSFELSDFQLIGDEDVVLVECFNIDNEENEFIWFSVPERFCDTFKNI